MKFYDDGDPFQFWDSFEAALSTRLLKKHPATLLKHCLSQRTNATAFFRDIVSEKEAQIDFDLTLLKSLFMDQYAGVFWRATAYTRLFAIGYIEGENVKTFIDRFSAAAHQANLDMSSTDPEMNLLKTMIVAKLPDSVKRLIGSKKPKDFDSCTDLIKVLKTYNGIPDDGNNNCQINCPKCLKPSKHFSCSSKTCNFTKK